MIDEPITVDLPLPWSQGRFEAEVLGACAVERF